MAAYRRVYDSRHRLTAKNRDQLRKPTLEYGLPVRVRVRCEGQKTAMVISGEAAVSGGTNAVR